MFPVPLLGIHRPPGGLCVSRRQIWTVPAQSQASPGGRVERQTAGTMELLDLIERASCPLASQEGPQGLTASQGPNQLAAFLGATLSSPLPLGTGLCHADLPHTLQDSSWSLRGASSFPSLAMKSWAPSCSKPCSRCCSPSQVTTVLTSSKPTFHVPENTHVNVLLSPARQRELGTWPSAAPPHHGALVTHSSAESHN